MIAAAAQGCPQLPTDSNAQKAYAEWLQRQPEATKDAWLAHLLMDSHSTVRREILADYQKSRGTTSWPTIALHRTIAELKTAADELQRRADHKAEVTAAQTRDKKLAKMAADPTATLRETERLVAQRSTNAYGQAAAQLADLRTVLAGTAQAGLAEQQARNLKDKNPKLNMLTSELRRKGFLPK